MKLTDESPMPFGKFKNKKMMEVPADYLLWLYDQRSGMKPFGEASQAVRDYTMENLEVLKKESDERKAWKDCDATESDLY